jgi:YtkA-like protein
MRSLVGSIGALLLLAACGCGDQAAPLKELQRAKSGNLNVVLLSAGDSLKQGKGTFVIEFRDPGGGLVDVGTVNVSASMPMAGMAPMFGDCMVMPTATKGRYDVASDLGMAGTWRLQIAWNGPAGRGSASLPGSVL